MNINSDVFNNRGLIVNIQRIHSFIQFSLSTKFRSTSVEWSHAKYAGLVKQLVLFCTRLLVGL